MKSVALPAIVLVVLIAAFFTWLLWPTPLARALKARDRGDYVTAVAKLRPLAQAGNPEAEFALGQLVAAGHGAAQDTGLAIEWFLKAATQHNADAALVLGDRYSQGDGVQASILEALAWYRRAIEAGNMTGLERIKDLAKSGSAGAKNELGVLYAQGAGIPESKTVAAQWFRQAAAQGNESALDSLKALVTQNVPEAAFQLGQMYERGENVPVEMAKAAAFYERAAANDHMLAQLRLAELYAQGKGVSRNETAAAKWYGKAAGQGQPEAQFRYGMMRMHGTGVARDDGDAVHWLRAAAEGGVAGAVAPLRVFANQGNTTAQYELATLYTQGKLVPQDATAAFGWLRKAAEAGLPLAQFDLAFAYSQGQGTPANPSMAARWYGEAVNQGFATAVPKLAQLASDDDPVAQYYYGRYLVHGGTPMQRSSDQTDDLIHIVLRWYRAMRHDPVQQGVALLRSAAEAGNPEAQTELGRMYLTGKGVATDKAAAATWFEKAAAQGSVPAADALKQLHAQ